MEFNEKFDMKHMEEQVQSCLNKVDLQNLIQNTKLEKVRFIEGPPTLNGTPHAGHMRGRIIKDMFYRTATLQGKHVIFNAGYDTQGLPIELQAEKELNVTGGKAEAVREFGAERIIEECRKVVKKYESSWRNLDYSLGVSFDHDNAYYTYDDSFIEREWQILKHAHESGILEESYTVIAYCPSCQTSLSHAEVKQGYEEVKDPSLYYKVKLTDDTYLVVWTTMPFTLVTDAMVGVHPDEKYVKISVDDEIWIVGKVRLEALMKEINKEYEIKGEILGSNLDGKKYTHPLLEHVPMLNEYAKGDNFHVVVAEKFVDVNTGSGLVHLSPANGEEDIKIAKKRNVKIFNPINDEAKFNINGGKYRNMYVRDADRIIVDDLRDCNALVKIGKIKHKYPLCWRSKHPLVWLARRGYFYNLGKLNNMAVSAASKVEYFFEQPKNRFMELIKEKHPWCISRERLWGCPLPVWKCTDCNKENWLFTRQEIIGAAIDLPDGENFDLHRPYVDNIKIKCRYCNGISIREEFVLDTWHNSGSAPYSSLTDQEYDQNIPVEFLSEGIDQTRGWAYTMLIENIILKNKAVSPYMAFLFQGHVLDKDGNKMSKSKGNVLEGSDLLNEYPADLLRLYFMYKCSPIEPLKFDSKEMTSRPYQILSTLHNLHLYFWQNGKFDKYDESFTLNWANTNNHLTQPDLYLLSKLQSLISTVTDKNASCKFHEATHALDEYIINTLSQTYVPIIRNELWDEDDGKKDRRMAIYAVLSHVLKTLDMLLHPVCPFITEYFYQTMFKSKESILLENYPTIDENFKDTSLEEAFDAVKNVTSISNAARMKANLKRRWPLNEALICVPVGEKEKLEKLSELLLSNFNVENFKIVEIKSKLPLETYVEMKRLKLPVSANISLDMKKVGKKAKKHVPALLKKFEMTNHESIITSLVDNGKYEFDLEETISLDIDDFTINIDASEGYEISTRNNHTVLISTVRNREMTARGLLKDVARCLQSLRKDLGHNPNDILNRACIDGLQPDEMQMVREKSDDLMFLARVKQICFGSSCNNYKEVDIDGQKIKISVE